MIIGVQIFLAVVYIGVGFEWIAHSQQILI